jgi:cell division protein FtsL
MLRLLNIAVIGALVLAAAWLYEIKYSSTRQAEQVAKLRLEIRRERDAIAALRAEWAQLDNPDRIQILARRHLTLKPIEATQFDSLDRLPEKPIEIVPPGTADPIGALIEHMVDPEVVTSSVPDSETRQ